MKKWRPQRKGETEAQYEARRQVFGAKGRVRAARVKGNLNARRAKGQSEFLGDTTGVRRPASFQPSMVPQKPYIMPLPLPDRSSSHLRGIPPDDTLRAIRRKYKPAIRLAGTEEMATIDRLLTTVVQIEEGLKRQPRKRGKRLECKTLRELLGFLYRQRISLRSSDSSEAVHEYARKLAVDEPNLANPQATARSRLRRLTDLRRKQGFPEPTPGRKRK